MQDFLTFGDVLGRFPEEADRSMIYQMQTTLVNLWIDKLRAFTEQDTLLPVLDELPDKLWMPAFLENLVLLTTFLTYGPFMAMV